MPRLLLVVVCLWVAAVAAQSSTALSQQTPPQTTSPQTPAPAAAQPAPQTPALPAGYAGSDTCVLCHTDQEGSLKGTQHGRAKNPRSPGRGLWVRELPRSGSGARRRRGQGATSRSSRQMKPADVSQTCLTCHNRGAHAGWEGSTHEATEPLVHDVPQRSQAGVVRASAREDNRNRSCAPPAIGMQVIKTERAVAHMPVREGKMACSSCHNPHGSISNVKALKVGSSVTESCTSCHTEMRGPGAVGARARARELHDVPRPARVVERSHAGRPHADAVPAVPRRDAASGVDLRQQRHHGEQEQPDVRPVVRELPFERPRLESPVGPVLHAVAACRARQ